MSAEARVAGEAEDAGEGAVAGRADDRSASGSQQVEVISHRALQGPLEGELVHLAGEVDRAPLSSLQGIPVRGLRLAEELNLQTDPSDRLDDGKPLDSLRGRPCGSTGSAAKHVHRPNRAAGDGHDIFGSAELLAIGSEADLPREPASRGRSDGALEGDAAP